MATVPSGYSLGLLPVEYDDELQEGSTWVREWVYEDDEGTAVDLTGYTAAMSLKRTPESASVLDLTTANGRITLNEDEDGEDEDGVIRWVVPAADSVDIVPLTYLYDFVLTNGAIKETLMFGKIKVRGRITT